MVYNLHRRRFTMTIAYNKLTDEIKNEIVDFYYANKNMSNVEISAHFNLSKRALRRILQEKGINGRLKNRYTLDEAYFEKIETEQQAYLLGFLYADGFVGNEKFNNIVVQVKDEEIVTMFKKAIDFTGDIREVKSAGGFSNSSQHYSLNFSSEKMASDLRSLGLYPGKSTTMSTLPNIPNELYRHFVRGYFDGDGSICVSNRTSYHTVGGERKKYTYKTYILDIIGTKPFMEEIAKLLPGNYLSIKESKSKDMYYLHCSSKHDMKKIFEYLYDGATYYLERKYIKFSSVKSDISE